MATVKLTGVPGTSFTSKLINACANNSLYAAGTVFDCSDYKGTQNLTTTVRILRSGITLGS